MSGARPALVAAGIDPDLPQRRRLRIPSAAFARSQVSGTQEDLIPGSWPGASAAVCAALRF